MNGRPLGLRLQIISSLAILIILLSGLLGFAIVRISGTALLRERMASVRLVHLSAARSILSAISSGSGIDVVEKIASSWIKGGSIDGIWIFDGSGKVKKVFTEEGLKRILPKPFFPLTEIYSDINFEVKVLDGGSNKPANHIFTQYPAGRGIGCVIIGTDRRKIVAASQYLGILLLIYLLVHGLAILVFGYFSLTTLIVRPVENLKFQAVRLGEGKFDIEISGGGAKEVQELAHALVAASKRLKNQRDELTQKIEQLEKAQNELLKSRDAIIRAQKLASVGRLTAGVAHEIGNPLTAIIGFIDLVSDESIDADKKKEFLERMRKEAERMDRIIKDLLTYARADGKELKNVSLEEVIKEACQIMKPQKIFKGINVELNIEKDIPPVRVNKDRMVQVMVNLLLNAGEAMVGEGKIEIGLKKGEDGKTVTIIVEDSGPGIPENIIDDIFEPFVTTKPEGQGTGLGLAVCHGIIRSFGGTIRAENRIEGGARFIIELPIKFNN